ncbi:MULTISPECIES: ATP-binding protein [Streptomyces]|uniref:ATP-binding protein n=1 Tax=Streptomyces TaxID=1883 RepID=UPI0031D02314
MSPEPVPAPRGLVGRPDRAAPWCLHDPAASWPVHRTPPSAALALPPVPGSVAAARRFSNRLLAEWGLAELAADAALLLSELVTNAIVHVPPGCGDVRLVIGRTPRHLLAQVTDAGGCLPICSEAGPDSEGGRGMWLVEQIAAAWGHHASAGGKTVWFTLPLPGTAPTG